MALQLNNKGRCTRKETIWICILLTLLLSMPAFAGRGSGRAVSGNIGCEVNQISYRSTALEVNMWDQAWVGTGMTFDVYWTVTYLGRGGKREVFKGVQSNVHVKPTNPGPVRRARFNIGVSYLSPGEFPRATVVMDCRRRCGARDAWGRCIDINERLRTSLVLAEYGN